MEILLSKISGGEGSIDDENGGTGGLREAVSNIIIKRTGAEAAVEEVASHQQDRQVCNCSVS